MRNPIEWGSYTWVKKDRKRTRIKGRERTWGMAWVPHQEMSVVQGPGRGLSCTETMAR